MSPTTFILPGGYVDRGGAAHREIEIAPLTGRVEEYLQGLPEGTLSARAITGLLGRCIRRIGSLGAVDEDLSRDMLVGDREFAVMKLREMTWGPDVDVFLRCPNEQCAKALEFRLSLADMATEPRPVSSRHFHLSPSEGPVSDLSFRLPNGADQEYVAGIADSPAAAAALLARCTGLEPETIGTMPAAVQREIEEEIERLAPQTEAELEAACPECGHIFRSQIGWPEFCLEEMRNQSVTLEREVHFLALHYHWSESEVLSMTHTKRRRYVALLEEEIERRDEAQ